MARRARKPPRGKEIMAKLAFDPDSLKRFERALLQLKEAAREEVIDEALTAGAKVVAAAQIRRAPGPYIEIEFVKNVASLQKGSATGLMKKNISSKSRFIAIGPDKKHWYYRFHEFGTKVHGVAKRKRTRAQQTAARTRVKRTPASKRSRTRPMMSWVQGGERIFARQVSGIPAKPFIRPSIDDNGTTINTAMGKVMSREIKKAAKG